MSKDTSTKELSNKELLKAYILDGNVVNWRIAESEPTPDKPFYIRSLPQRMLEIDRELQEAGIGCIRGELRFHPRRTDYWLERYTEEDKVMKDT